MLTSKHVLALVLSAAASSAQAPVDLSAAYVKTELMIPMRDGVELFTQIYEPTDSSREYPVLLFRTPYGIGFYEKMGFRPSGPEQYMKGMLVNPMVFQL